MIHDMAVITDSRCNGLFMFFSTAREKLENLNKIQRRGRVLPQEHISRFEVKLWRDSYSISVQLHSSTRRCVTAEHFHACHLAAVWSHGF